MFIVKRLRIKLSERCNKFVLSEWKKKKTYQAELQVLLRAFWVPYQQIKMHNKWEKGIRFRQNKKIYVNTSLAINLAVHY